MYSRPLGPRDPRSNSSSAPGRGMPPHHPTQSRRIDGVATERFTPSETPTSSSMTPHTITPAGITPGSDPCGFYHAAGVEESMRTRFCKPQAPGSYVPTPAGITPGSDPDRTPTSSRTSAMRQEDITPAGITPGSG